MSRNASFYAKNVKIMDWSINQVERRRARLYFTFEMKFPQDGIHPFHTKVIKPEIMIKSGIRNLNTLISLIINNK